MNPFDYIKSINKKEYCEDLSGFSVWMTNKVFSADPNFVCLTNCVNKLNNHNLSKKTIYDFYYYTIPKNRKFLGYPKGEKELKKIKYIQEYYKLNEEQAKEYSNLLTKKEIKKVVDYFEKRGRK